MLYGAASEGRQSGRQLQFFEKHPWTGNIGPKLGTSMSRSIGVGPPLTPPSMRCLSDCDVEELLAERPTQSGELL